MIEPAISEFEQQVCRQAIAKFYYSKLRGLRSNVRRIREKFFHFPIPWIVVQNQDWWWKSWFPLQWNTTKTLCWIMFTGLTTRPLGLYATVKAE